MNQNSPVPSAARKINITKRTILRGIKGFYRKLRRYRIVLPEIDECRVHIQCNLIGIGKHSPDTDAETVVLKLIDNLMPGAFIPEKIAVSFAEVKTGKIAFLVKDIIPDSDGAPGILQPPRFLSRTQRQGSESGDLVPVDKVGIRRVVPAGELLHDARPLIKPDSVSRFNSRQHLVTTS